MSIQQQQEKEHEEWVATRGKSAFERLAAINVNEHTEKKNNLTYLSWAWAVDQLMRADPAANWTYLEPLTFGETMMVRCSVTAFGKTMTSQLPVMNHRNQPIPNPNAFEVNTAMQRCLVKAIALHGLGLYIYAGEDVPDGEQPAEPTPIKTPNTPTQQMHDAFEALEVDEQTMVNDWAAQAEKLAAHSISDAYADVTENLATIKDHETRENWKMALSSRLSPKTRNALKVYGQSLRKAA